MSQEKVQSILAILGALVPVLSALASLLNHVVRERQAAGEPVSDRKSTRLNSSHT